MAAPVIGFNRIPSAVVWTTALVPFSISNSRRIRRGMTTCPFTVKETVSRSFVADMPIVNHTENVCQSVTRLHFGSFTPQRSLEERDQPSEAGLELNCFRETETVNFFQLTTINSQLLHMNDTYVPLITSGVAGPLGVLHLPRLWQKVSLEAAGKLADGYPGMGRGYDAMTCAALGLDEQAVQDYIKQSKPTYPQFEAWVKKNAKSLNPQAVEKHNAAVRGYIHDDDTRKTILGACGIPDDASAPKDAVNLNNLDDWYAFHQQVLK